MLTYHVPAHPGGGSGTVTLADIGDTYIQQDDAAKNYGTASEMKVRPQSTKLKHALLKFDISGVPCGCHGQCGDVEGERQKPTGPTSPARSTG